MRHASTSRLAAAGWAALALACAAPPTPPRRTPTTAPTKGVVRKPQNPGATEPPGPPAGPEPVTAANWRTHPAVAEVDALVAEQEAEVAARRWPRTDSQVCAPGSGGGGFGLDRSVYLDGRGRIRKYVVSEGTDAAAFRLEHHYDERGRLRFAAGTAGATNGATARVRLWLDEQGSTLWTDRARSGPSYPFPAGWPEYAVVRDPAKDFVRPGPQGCGR